MKLRKEKDSFFINNKKKFKGNHIKNTDLINAFDFAFEMAFGKGHHRVHRSGGNTIRQPIEIFRNALQGKLAEIIVHNYLKSNEVITEPVDFSISGEGVWDDSDLIVNDKKISIKSAAFFSNLLLLETADWDTNGNYIPNNFKEISDYTYDFFILVRIKPNTNSIFKNYYNKESLKNELNSLDWFYDIPGCFSLKTLKYLIKNEYILPQNSLLNGKIKMDAENYYIQTGNLRDINVLLKQLI